MPQPERCGATVCGPRVQQERSQVKEIRVNWIPAVHHEQPERFGGVWIPDSAEARARLQAIVDDENAFYSQGSHWIEEREA